MFKTPLRGALQHTPQTTRGWYRSLVRLSQYTPHMTLGWYRSLPPPGQALPQQWHDGLHRPEQREEALLLGVAVQAQK